MLKRFSLLLIIALFVYANLHGQSPSQTIRGIIIDNASNAPIAYANLILLNTNPVIGTSSDIGGNFRLNNVPVGRYDIQVSYVGYEPTIIREVQVSSAKETFLTISIKENATGLNEVVIKPNVNKEAPLNQMATVSARMLSVDEASRYAGGFDDPARLAASFAGVASNVGNNGIMVRGNSPKYLQWKMEGIEIHNPNHFADVSAFGGGGLTALSTMMLANSDFLTGAFPAEYGNALSGVFDIFMRTGNNEKNESSFQLGVIGIEASSEGPFKKGKRSSYLFNYRYSTLGLIAPLLPENAGGVTYQDLSFKMTFPTKKAGVIFVWGIGLIDGSGQKAKTDSTKWFYKYDKEQQDVNQFMGAAGISHKIYFDNNLYLKTTLAATVYGIDLKTDLINSGLKLQPENKINNKTWDFVLSSFVNSKFGARHTNKTGLVVTGLMYDMLFKNVVTPDIVPQTIVDVNGFSTLLSVFTSSTFKLTENLSMNVGGIAQLFTLNKHYTIEPRLGIKWQFKPAQSLGLAYGSHSRLERLNYYFTKGISNNNAFDNKNLDFTKACHLVLGYDLDITENVHLKAEAYFQQLYNVPVITDSSFSFINLQNDWFFDHKLVNDGKGINYGLEVTLEQYLTKGSYYLFTISAFNSKYQGGDGIWRNTRYNRNFLFNFLSGKEWQFGKNRQNVFGVNIRLCYQGGDHYSPVNIAASMAAMDAIYDETKAFSSQYPASFTSHFTISYKMNKKKTTKEIAFKIINATMFREFQGFQYNYIRNTVDKTREGIFIPNLSYKIDF